MRKTAARRVDVAQTLDGRAVPRTERAFARAAR